MTNVFKNVKEFHKAFNLPIKTELKFPNSKERILRGDLLEEEMNEYFEAEESNDMVEVADALADIIYICCGTALTYGIPLEKIFEEVHRSNMAKLVDGKVLYHPSGKVKKPEGWTAPDIQKILDEVN